MYTFLVGVTLWKGTLSEVHILFMLHLIHFKVLILSIVWNFTFPTLLKLKLLVYEHQQVQITSKMVILGD